MNRSRIYTRPPLLRRLASNRWVGAIAALIFICALCSIAEAGCTLIGVEYDSRIEVAA